MSQKVQLYSLSCSPGQPRRTYFEGETFVFSENRVSFRGIACLCSSSWQRQPCWFWDVIFAFSRSKVAKAELTCSTKCELLFYKRFILHCNFKVLFFNLTVSVNYCFRRVNVGCGPAEERVLLTGLHAVADIYCECCKTTLGWKYVSITFRFFFVWQPNNTRVISWENFPRVFRSVEGKHTIMQISRHDDNNSPWALLKLVAQCFFTFISFPGARLWK